MTLPTVPAPAAAAPDAVGRFVRHRATPWALLGMAMVLCLGAWYHGHRSIRRHADERFLYATDTVTELLHQRLRDYDTALRGAAAFVRASPGHSRASWREYVDSLGLGTTATVSLGFVPRVAPWDWAAFERRLHDEGAGVAASAPAGPADRLPLAYLAPESLSRFLTPGTDLASDPAFASALERAAATGEPVLVDVPTAEAGTGMALAEFLPVYAPGARPGTADQRRAALVGFVLAVFRPADVARAAAATAHEGLGFVLREQDSGRVLHRDGIASGAVASPTFSQERIMSAAGRPWVLEFVADGRWYLPAERAMSLAVGLGSVVVNVAVGLLLFAHRRVRRAADALVAEKDSALTRSEGAFLAVTESARVAIVLADAQGRFTYANAAAEEMFGVPRARLIGDSSTQYVAPVDRARFSDGLQKFVAGEGRISAGAPTPILGVRASGEEFPAEISLSWFDGADGRYITGVIVDLSERVRAEAAALEAEARWKVAVESTDDGVWDWDIERGVLHGSRRLFEMLGHESPDDTMSDDVWTSLIHPDDLATARDDLYGHLGGHRPQYVSEYRTRMPDGSYRWILGRGRVISRTSEGTPLRMVGTSTDIDERRRAEETLRYAREQAEQATTSKSDFLAMMSHELRTPMNGVLGMTNLLSTTELTNEQREYLDMIGRSGNALLRLIDDILDFSKIEAGRVVLEQVSSDVGAIAHEVVTLLGVQAHTRGLVLDATVAPGTPTIVITDPGRVRQVLFNLVGNAIKFTEAGSVTVHVGADHVSDSRATLRVTVTDTGIGIPEEKQRLLFEKFTQADASTTRRFGGTGLGLAISKGLVESLGGAIGVNSVVGQGATFWFTFQAQLATLATPEPEPFPVDTESVAPYATPSPLKRVLVVEDNPVNQRVAVRMLEKLGYAVDVAMDGREAVQMARDGRYTAIFMDCHMPELDGFEATRQIRQLVPDDARPPILAMTAAASEGDRERCLAAGMDDYLRKPVQMPELRAMLERWVRTSPVG